MNFEIGKKYPIYRKFGFGKPYLIHVLAIVDDYYVVYKWYGRHKQWWHYGVDYDRSLRPYLNDKHKSHVSLEDGL